MMGGTDLLCGNEGVLRAFARCTTREIENLGVERWEKTKMSEHDTLTLEPMLISAREVAGRRSVRCGAGCRRDGFLRR